jgi:hypothetical protein
VVKILPRVVENVNFVCRLFSGVLLIKILNNGRLIDAGGTEKFLEGSSSDLRSLSGTEDNYEVTQKKK